MIRNVSFGVCEVTVVLSRGKTFEADTV